MLDYRRTRTDMKRLLLGKATALEIRKTEHEKPGYARQLSTGVSQTDTFTMSFHQPGLKELLQLLDLSAELALANRITR